MLIKVKFLKNEVPQGKEYTYESLNLVNVEDKVTIGNATAIVTEINVPEEGVASYRDKIKKIDGKVEVE